MEKIKVLSLDRIMELFEEIPDPRRPGGNIQHKMVDLLVIILLGVISGCETWIEIEETQLPVDLTFSAVKTRNNITWKNLSYQ